MNQELTHALQTLRYHSQISEALLAHARGTGARIHQVIEACRVSMDVIERIAQDLLEGQYHKAWFIQELNDALVLLDDFSSELARSPLQIPSRNDIQTLLTQISHDTAQPIEMTTVVNKPDFGLDGVQPHVPTTTLNLLQLGIQEQIRINEAATREQWPATWHDDQTLRHIGELAVEQPAPLCDALFLLLDGWFSYQRVNADRKLTHTG
jgi:hypothetical protein